MNNALLPVLQCKRNECNGHGEPQLDHECPYASDIHDDHETMCNCCLACERECADDI